MIELLVIFQVLVKKTVCVQDLIIPVPRWLPHRELLRIVKESVAAVEWAGAILNIINMDDINPAKIAPVKQDEGRKHSSFALRRSQGRPNGRSSEHRSARKFEPRTEWSDDKESGFRDRPAGGGYRGKPAWGWFRGKSSRPARSSRAR